MTRRKGGKLQKRAFCLPLTVKFSIWKLRRRRMKKKAAAAVVVVRVYECVCVCVSEYVCICMRWRLLNQRESSSFHFIKLSHQHDKPDCDRRSLSPKQKKRDRQFSKRLQHVNGWMDGWMDEDEKLECIFPSIAELKTGIRKEKPLKIASHIMVVWRCRNFLKQLYYVNSIRRHNSKKPTEGFFSIPVLKCTLISFPSVHLPPSLGSLPAHYYSK